MSKKFELADLVSTAKTQCREAVVAIGEANITKDKAIATLVLIRKDWHEVAAFDPTKGKNAERNKLELAVNEVRLDMKAFETERKAKDPNDSWGQLKARYREQLAGKDTSAKIGAGAERSDARDFREMFASAALKYHGQIADLVKKDKGDKVTQFDRDIAEAVKVILNAAKTRQVRMIVK